MDYSSIPSNTGASSSIISSLLNMSDSDKTENRQNFPQDRVSISSEGQKLSEKRKDLPLEAYSFPSWMGDLLTDHLIVDTKIGINYKDSNIGKYNALSRSEKNKISAYNGAVLNFFREELENRGVDTTEKYYNSVILDEEQSKDIHQIVLERLKSDKRISALMDYFGKG